MNPVSDRELRLPHSADTPLVVVQITDTHLAGRPGGRLAGMDTDRSLQRVLDAIAAAPGPDLLLVTGDIADRGETAAYRRLGDYLSRLDVPQAWLPGNHDDRAAMTAVAGERLLRRVVAGNWQIVLLDSQIPGTVGGELSKRELDALDRLLKDAPAGSHTLVCLHHQPLSVDSAWLDEQQVVNGHALLARLAEAPSVRAVLWGHVHQEFDRTVGGIRLLASPSTCVQFAPFAERFAIDDRAPGYRWLTLHPDGRLDTGVVRVDNTDLAVDLCCDGY